MKNKYSESAIEWKMARSLLKKPVTGFDWLIIPNKVIKKVYMLLNDKGIPDDKFFKSAS